MINQVHQGDCLEVLKTIPDNSVDACVADPPYGLGEVKDFAGLLRDWLADGDGSNHVGKSGFMGSDWDATVPPPVMWKELFRVLKPGAYALIFSGTRTQDLMGLSLRLAGFESRGSLCWVNGSGFPKSLDVGKQDEEWTGYKTQLKPAHEPILIVRKPLDGTTVENVRRWGTGAFNVDACRVEHNQSNGQKGRYPSDFLLTHAYDCEPGGVCSDSCPIRLLGEQSGECKSGGSAGTRNFETTMWQGLGKKTFGDDVPPSSGTAARYFWQCYPDAETPFIYQGKATKRDRTCNGAVINHHPTVKPRELIKYLCKLIMPPSPNAVLIDPFGGSGTTALACEELGFNYILIEREVEYAYLINQRIAATTTRVQPEIEQRLQWLETQVSAQASKIRKLESQQLSLFG